MTKQAQDEKMNATLKRMLNTPPKQHKSKPDSEAVFKGRKRAAGGKTKEDR